MIVGPGKSSTQPATSPARIAAESIDKKIDAAIRDSSIQVTGPPIDVKSTERRAWEFYESAIKFEQREEYGGAVKQYEWIEQLRLPDCVRVEADELELREVALELALEPLCPGAQAREVG